MATNKTGPKDVPGVTIKDLSSRVENIVGNAVKQVRKSGVPVASSSNGLTMNIDITQSSTGGAAIRKDLLLTEQQIKETEKASESLKKSLSSKQASTGINKMLNFKPLDQLLKQAETDLGEIAKASSKSKQKTTAASFWNTINAYSGLAGQSENQVLATLKVSAIKNGADNRDIEKAFSLLEKEFPNNISNTVNTYVDSYQAALLTGITQGVDNLIKIVVSAAEDFYKTKDAESLFKFNDKFAKRIKELSPSAEKEIDALMNEWASDSNKDNRQDLEWNKQQFAGLLQKAKDENLSSSVIDNIQKDYQDVVSKGSYLLEDYRNLITEQINSIFGDYTLIQNMLTSLSQGTSQANYKNSKKDTQKSANQITENIEQRKEFLSKYIVDRNEFQATVTQLIQEEQQLLQDAENATSKKKIQELQAQAKQKRAEIYKYIAGQKSQGSRGENFVFDWFKTNYGKDNEYMSGFRTSRKNSLIGHGVSQDWAESQVRDIFDIEHWGVSTWDEAANQANKMGAKILSNISNMEMIVDGIQALSDVAKQDPKIEHGFINKGDVNTAIIHGQDGMVPLMSLLKSREGQGAQIDFHTHNGQGFAYPSPRDLSNWLSVLNTTFGSEFKNTIHAVLADPTLGDEIALFNPNAIPKDLRQKFINGLGLEEGQVSKLVMDPYGKTPGERFQQGLRNYIQDFGLSNVDEIFQVMKASDFLKITNASIQQGLNGGNLIPSAQLNAVINAQNALLDAINEDEAATRADANTKKASAKAIEAATNQINDTAESTQAFKPRSLEDIKNELNSQEAIPVSSTISSMSKKEVKSFWGDIRYKYGGLYKSGNSLSTLDNGLSLIDRQLTEYLERATQFYNIQDTGSFKENVELYQSLRGIKEYYNNQLDAAIARDLENKLKNVSSKWTQEGLLKDVSIESISTSELNDPELVNEYQRLSAIDMEQYTEATYKDKISFLKNLREQESQWQQQSLAEAQNAYKQSRSVNDGTAKIYGAEYLQHIQNITKIDQEIATLQSQYDEYMVQKAAEEAAAKEQQKAAAEKVFKPITTDQMRKKALEITDGFEPNNPFGYYVDQRDLDQDFGSLEGKINAYKSAREEAKADQQRVVEQLRELYNANEGNVDFDEVGTIAADLIQQFAKYEEEKTRFFEQIQYMEEELKAFKPTERSQALDQIEQYKHLLSDDANPIPEDLFTDWGAEVFKDDYGKTIDSFQNALQRLKDDQLREQQGYKDRFVELFQGAESLGKDPWLDSNVIQMASNVKYYDNGIKIFEEKIAELQKAKAAADQAAQKQATSSAWTQENSQSFEKLAKDIDVLVQAVQNLQKAFATLDQSEGAKGLLDALSNISTLLQQGLSSQITEYTEKTKQLFELNREFSTALTKSGEPATTQVSALMSQTWTDTSKFDNLQWNIQQFEELQKIAQSTGFVMDEFKKRYQSITTDQKSNTIFGAINGQEGSNGLASYISQLDIIIKKFQTIADLLSSTINSDIGAMGSDTTGNSSNRSLDDLTSKAYKSAAYQAFEKQRIQLREEWTKLSEEINKTPSKKPVSEWTPDEAAMVDTLGKIMVPTNPKWEELHNKKDAIQKELDNLLSQMNQLLLDEEPMLHFDDFKKLNTAIKDKYTGFRKNDTGTGIDTSQAYIVEMSPEEYLARSAAMFNDTRNAKTNLTMQVRGLDRSQIDALKEKIQTGEQMYTPWLDERGINGQEGRHRAAAAYELGIPKIPVVYWPKDQSRIPQTPAVSSMSVGDEEIQKLSSISQEVSNFESLRDVLKDIDTYLTNIVVNLPQVRLPDAALPPTNTNMNTNTNNGNVPGSAPAGSANASSSPASSGQNVPTPQNPLPVAVYASPAGTIKSQQGYSWEDGSTFIKRTGWASEQSYKYVKDQQTGIVNLEKLGDERMNYDSLSKQIAKVDEQILKLDHDMAQIQTKYPNIDLTPWKQQRVALGEVRKSMLKEAEDYGRLPEYEPSYKQFKEQRLQNIKRITADLQKQTNIASERELLEVQHRQTQLQQRAASIHSGLHGTSQYQDVMSQIANATSLADIENAEKALNRLKATIEQLKGQAKNVSGSLDPLQNMFKTRDLKGQFYINELITKFEKLGLDGKTKVAPLQAILDNWKQINIDAADIGDGTGRNGLQAFGDYIEEFNKQRYTLEAKAKTIKTQQQINAKNTKDEKKVDVENYKQLLAAIQNVTDAQKQLQAVEKEAAKDQTGIVDYTQKINDAKIHLDLMKDSLKDVLDMVYGKTSLSDLTPDFFTNPAHGTLLNQDSLSPAQLRAFGKAQARMTGTEEDYNQNQLKAVASAYADVTKAVEAYNKAASDINKSSDAKLMTTLQQNVETTSKAYYDLINNIKQLIPQFTPILDQFKQNNPIRDLFDKEGISNSFLTRLELVRETLQGLADVKVFDGTTVTGQMTQIDSIGTNFTDALKNAKSTKDIFDAIKQGNADLQNLQIEPFLKDLVKVQTVLSNLGTDARSNTWTDHISKIGQVLNNMFNAKDDGQIQAYRNQLEGLLKTAKEIADPTLMQNKNGYLLDQGQIKNASDMTAQMDKYAKAAQLGSLVTEKWNADQTKVTRTYKTTSGQITQLTGQVEKLSNAWRMSSTVSQGQNAFLTGFSKSIGGVIHQLPMLIMGYSAVMRLRSELTAGMNTFKEYDSTLTNISYTMNMTSKELDALGKSAIDMAKDLSMSVANAEDVYKIYANMNTSAEEIQQLAKPTVILSNLSGVDASTAADEVQGIIQQFDMLKDSEADAADVSMHVVDVLNDISANVAMDYSFN